MVELARVEARPFAPGAMGERERVGLPAFFAILFAVSWTGMLPMILASRGVRLPGPLLLLQLLMLFGPALAALFTAWRNGGRPAVGALLRGLARWRCAPALYLAVLAGPAAVFALGLLLSNAVGFTAVPFPPAAKAASAFAMAFGAYLLLNTEELAWRGYALPRLQAAMGSTRATLLLAIVWILFHLPLFWLKGGHPAGYPFWLFSLMLVGLSFLFTAVFEATAGSILMAHLLHQSFNAAVEAVPVYPRVTHSLAPVAISTALFLVVVAVLWIRNERTRRGSGKARPPPADRNARAFARTRRSSAAPPAARARPSRLVLGPAGAPR